VQKSAAHDVDEDQPRVSRIDGDDSLVDRPHGVRALVGARPERREIVCPDEGPGFRAGRREIEIARPSQRAPLPERIAHGVEKNGVPVALLLRRPTRVGACRHACGGSHRDLVR
jgi:hypothetical protein